MLTWGSKLTRTGPWGWGWDGGMEGWIEDRGWRIDGWGLSLVTDYPSVSATCQGPFVLSQDLRRPSPSLCYTSLKAPVVVIL